MADVTNIICVGIGDILLIKLLFETHGLRDSINVNRAIVRAYKKNSDAYWTFVQSLLTILFPKNQVNYIDTSKYQF